MTTSLDNVQITRRFRRSVRIDTDLHDSTALEGFVCPKSSEFVLLSIAKHVSVHGQGAFTWTGPYGSGKSTLVIALASLLSPDANARKLAAKTLGWEVSNKVWKALAVDEKGWFVLPIVGQRLDPVQAIGEALQATGLLSRKQPGGWTESYVLNKLTHFVSASSDSFNGLVVFIDEMGKFLEAAFQNSTDIYIFQQLAEISSRSNGRLIVVGVLHQAFAEYAHHLSREQRDEWTKIQGRFVDLAVNASGDEQVELIARAIDSSHEFEGPSDISVVVAQLFQRGQKIDIHKFATTLENCWPLHPIVTCLLGPISRRRFGQNQRSIFGFLNSAELHGFQNFLHRSEENALYMPSRLWDYLRVNLEPSILASLDGHRWAMASEALERCESIGGDELQIRILKTIAVIDLFKERSGLSPSVKLLRTCFSDISESIFKKALKQLMKWSLIIYKIHLDAYAIYAGSDFDIDKAVGITLEEIQEVDFNLLQSLSAQQPLLAKRHYHSTGTLRWFDMILVPLNHVVEIAENYRPKDGAMGLFALALATHGESENKAHELCRKAARKSDNWDIVVGISQRSREIVALARELIVLERIKVKRPEVSGDSVARREVEARCAILEEKLESELHKSFNSAIWHRKNYLSKTYTQPELNQLASTLADRRFNKCPKIHNELLNRQRPSGSAVAAQNALLRRMVTKEGDFRLGIVGFPSERGLFDSLIHSTRLYARKRDTWCFSVPDKEDPCRLRPMWKAARKLLRENESRTVSVSEIYDLWRDIPFGVKDGIMTLFGVAFILSHRNNVAIYRERVFRTYFDDVDIDYLAKNADTIELRWMDLSTFSKHLLSAMAQLVCFFHSKNTPINLEPIEVARGLVNIYDKLPNWTKRTTHLSKNSVQVRDLFKRANDPNQFLFHDIPAIVNQQKDQDFDFSSEEAVTRVIEELQKGLNELVNAYSKMLQSLKTIMFTELQLNYLSQNSVVQIQERAKNLRGIAGDFRLEAFIGRLSQFDGTDEAFEGIVSLLINKPSNAWIDLDINQAMIEITDAAQQFLRVETYARVKGRMENRHTMAIVVGMKGQHKPIMADFHVGATEQEDIESIVRQLTTVLEQNVAKKHILLAALAEISAAYISESDELEIDSKDEIAH